MPLVTNEHTTRYRYARPVQRVTADALMIH
jgi:hypothetical protein